jgi:hypothetical protein
VPPAGLSHLGPLGGFPPPSQPPDGGAPKKHGFL